MKPWERLFGKGKGGEKLLTVPLEDIEMSPYQPRREFDDLELREMAQSIKEFGLIQPVIVRKVKGKYQLVAGERRLRACKIAGVKEIKAVEMDVSDAQAAAVSLIENIQRRNLNYLEEAEAYARMIGEFGMTQEEVANLVGRSQPAVANKLRLFKLDDEVRSRIDTDIITERHARALLRLDSADKQIEVLNAIYEKQLTVKETEKLIDEKVKEAELKRQAERKKNVMVIVKDARIFVNTIKEMIYRARENGVEIKVLERDSEEEHELIIKIPKTSKKTRKAEAAG